MMTVNTAACSAGGGRVRRHRKWIRQAVRSGGGRCPGVRAVSPCVNQTVACGLKTEPCPVSMPTFCPLPPVAGIIAPSTRDSVKSWYVYVHVCRRVCTCTGGCAILLLTSCMTGGGAEQEAAGAAGATQERPGSR